jgi:hypothetical protein
MFPGKMLKDTYTPQTLKLQVLTALSIAIVLPLIAVVPLYALYALVSLTTCFLVLALPFLMLALRSDPLAGLFSPALLLLRAGSIGAGVFWGLLMRLRHERQY